MTTETITAAAAGTWKLGDLTVHRMGFGAMRLPMADRGSAIRTLRRAVELGVNHIDTAAFYFLNLLSANELISSTLRPYPDDLVITTKVGPGRDPSGEHFAARPDQLRGQVEENLRQLGLDHFDVVNFRAGHTLDRATGSIGEHFGALAELRDAGLIRHLGISNIGPEQLAEARTIAPVVCVQNQYGLGVRREDDELVRVCGEQGIAFVPFFAVAHGHESAAVQAVANAHGVSAAQVRLAWTLHQGEHVLAIPGTGNPDHLAENIAAGALRLSEKELKQLDPNE